MMERFAIVAVIVLAVIFGIFLYKVTPEETPAPTVEVIYVTPQATPEPNVWIECYSGGEVIFEGSARDTFKNQAFDFSFGTVRWNDMDGSQHIFTNGEMCHIHR